MRKLLSAASSLVLPALHLIDAETAHRLSLEALKALPLACPAASDPRLSVALLGLSFANPFGIAAGFDKNAEVPRPLLALGFGHVEIGGVTPRPQSGNPRPRVFRLPADGALINRLGFNNDGMAAIAARLTSLRRSGGIIGANLGANKDSTDRTLDYVTLVQHLAPLVDYFTVNVSSPNTPGLRDLQAEAALDDLMAKIMEVRAAASHPRPVLLKIAPDITQSDLDGIVAVVRRRRVDGVVLTNTTIARHGLVERRLASESGGLSGKPLFERSTRLLAHARQRLGPDIALIGCGGVDSGAAAWAKIRAGASLVQLYTGLVYRGLPLLDEMKAEIAARLTAGGFTRLADAVGGEAADWASQPL